MVNTTSKDSNGLTKDKELHNQQSNGMNGSTNGIKGHENGNANYIADNSSQDRTKEIKARISKVPLSKCFLNPKLMFEKLMAIYEYTFTSEYVRQADKFYYNFSVFICLMTVYLLGASPGKYYLYWVTIIQAILYTKRFILFKHYGYHYFFVDYCYVGYVMQCFVFIMFNPGSKFFYYLSFSLSGVVYAVFLYTNQLVLHDIDKMTGSILHIIPFIN